MSDQLQDYRRIVLDCDFVNDWVPPIIASTGDLNGRKLLVKVTNNGTPVEANEQLHAALLVNPEPNNDYYFGDMVTMTPVEGYETAAFECPIPPGAVSKPGTTRMGVAFLLDNEGGEQDVICTRPFSVNVEQGVLRVDSDDAVGEFLEGVKQAQAAAAAAKQSETNAAQSASDAAESASQAAGSASAAAESERNAAQSASEAAESANTAGEHETAAGNSATAAAQSASQAAESAEAAAESASQAADSASAADTSASNAATSESNAKQSETNAASSATKAAASESNAKASETAAKKSETNAANSATRAGESATSASQSASAASQSASQAATSASQAAGSASAAAQSESNAASSASEAAESASQARDLVENFNLTVGETTTSEPGTNAVVEITKKGTVYTADFTIPRGEQGPRGENTAAISSVTGSVDNNVGTPSVDIVAGGTPEQRTLDFQFHNLKGQQGNKGDTGETGATPDITMTASVDDGYGTPSVEVSKTGTAEAPTFNIALHNLKGGVNTVAHDDTLTGDGTSSTPLGVADGTAITPRMVGKIDFNTAQNGVSYNNGGTLSNSPISDTGSVAGALVQFKGYADTVQLFASSFSYGYRNAALYLRCYAEAAWGEWRRMAFVDDIPTDYVSDSELAAQLAGYVTDGDLTQGLQAESSEREKQDNLLEEAINGKIAASNVKAGAGIVTNVSGSDVTVSASPNTINVTFEASLFSEGSLTARKAVSGLGSVNMVSPKASAANIAACQACSPWLADHQDDSSIPSGQVQCTVSSVPTADLQFIVTVLKG